MLSSEQEATAARVLHALAGPEAELRLDQRAAVEGLQQPGARVLVVQATGWGKSAVYWVATALRRASGAGITLVVSPLLSLMRDQVAAARRAGLRAETLNSSNVGEWSRVESLLAADQVDVLLVSPERLANPGFGRRVLNALTGRLGLFVVDEAHAVSDWGHDFRPDYRRVADTIARLNPTTPVLATTATANQRVCQDVAHQLGEQTLVLRGPLARRSLELSVVEGLTPLQRFAWVVESLPRLPGSGIVYALTVADAERLTEVLREVHGPGLPVAAYTGQLAGDERERLEEQLRGNQLKALVATSALGMGYDKPDLGFCVHVGSPPSPVSYYQQVGRAGRGIDHAAVVLLTSPADTGIWDYFATASIPQPRQVSALLAVLPGPGEAAGKVPQLEAESGLRRTKVDLLLKQLAVEGVVEHDESGWRATGIDWSFDQQHYDGVLAQRRREADIMRAYGRGERCLMQLLQESLDDPSAAACGRCSACTGSLPDGLSRVPAVEVTKQVSGLLRRQANLIEPRKMWPGGAFGGRGRIAAAEQVETGRALIHASAPEWTDLVAATFGAGPEQDAPPSEELVGAVVGLLSSWRADWPARPDLVVGLPAAAYAQLTAGLVRRICEIGRLASAQLPIAPADPLSRDLPSPDEAAYWRARLPAQDDPAWPTSVHGQVVLLLVDATSSLWPVTVAGAALRRAGATRVLPLVVHRPA